jgi:hypothetical protein
VFVIDEVEAYVRVAKQMVLYNLLDALTSSQVQVRQDAALLHLLRASLKNAGMRRKVAVCGVTALSSLARHATAPLRAQAASGNGGIRR